MAEEAKDTIDETDGCTREDVIQLIDALVQSILDEALQTVRESSAQQTEGEPVATTQTNQRRTKFETEKAEDHAMPVEVTTAPIEVHAVPATTDGAPSAESGSSPEVPSISAQIESVQIKVPLEPSESQGSRFTAQPVSSELQSQSAKLSNGAFQSDSQGKDTQSQPSGAQSEAKTTRNGQLQEDNKAISISSPEETELESQASKDKAAGIVEFPEAIFVVSIPKRPPTFIVLSAIGFFINPLCGAIALWQSCEYECDLLCPRASLHCLVLVDQPKGGPDGPWNYADAQVIWEKMLKTQLTLCAQNIWPLNNVCVLLTKPPGLVNHATTSVQKQYCSCSHRYLPRHP